MPPDPAATSLSGRAAAPALVQPLTAGILAAVVGFASSFTIVLQGLAGAGATAAQAASGLLALCVIKGLLGIAIGLRTRQPISIAWSTPGAALLVSAGVPAGGYPAAVGAFLVTALLIIAAGLWRPFGRAVVAIPMSLASAMLAGVLLELCLAPVKAVGADPLRALPIVLVWAAAWRFAPRYAVPLAVAATALVVVLATPLPPGALAGGWPHPLLVAPTFTPAALIGLALPLFIVTMASQNVPGLAVLRGNGYQPAAGPIFVATGLASGAIAAFGGHVVNLAAITAALCAGPEAGPDPARRWLASAAAGGAYVVLGLFAAVAAEFIAASPPLLIEAVAGLALLASLAAALASALAAPGPRVPAIVTFATTASGLSLFGIGAAFWGLAAGGLLLALDRWR